MVKVKPTVFMKIRVFSLISLLTFSACVFPYISNFFISTNEDVINWVGMRVKERPDVVY